MLHQFSRYGAQDGSICPSCVKIQIFMHFQLSIIVLGISASHFLEITMHISGR